MLRTKCHLFQAIEVSFRVALKKIIKNALKSVLKWYPLRVDLSSSCAYIGLRRGSRINGDRFSKQVPKAKASRGVRGMLPQIIFWTLKVQFLGSRDILKNLTDFRKTVETGMHPRLGLPWWFKSNSRRASPSFRMGVLFGGSEWGRLLSF